MNRWKLLRVEQASEPILVVIHDASLQAEVTEILKEVSWFWFVMRLIFFFSLISLPDLQSSSLPIVDLASIQSVQ